MLMLPDFGTTQKASTRFDVSFFDKLRDSLSAYKTQLMKHYRPLDNSS